MSTLKIWDLHMTYDGPITEGFLAGTKQLAESIAEEPGVIWKIWTAEEGTNHYGSTYLFRDRAYLETYKAMHMKRLAASGSRSPPTMSSTSWRRSARSTMPPPCG